MFKVKDVWINPVNIVSISDLDIEKETYSTNPDYITKIARGKINGMLIDMKIVKFNYTSKEEWERKKKEFDKFCRQYNDLLDWCKRNL